MVSIGKVGIMGGGSWATALAKIVLDTQNSISTIYVVDRNDVHALHMKASCYLIECFHENFCKPKWLKAKK